MPFRVLIIDGGGMRGLYTATYLAALEAGFSKRRNEPDGLDLGTGFDLIVGTSTGAILGCGLAMGIPPNTMAAIYKEKGRGIFPAPVPSGLNWRSIRGVLRRLVVWPNHLKCGEKVLREALEGVFGSTTVKGVYEKRKIALAIPSVDMATHKPWVFKTRHESTSMGRDDDYTLVDVCLATSAAPVFRSLAALDRPSADGFDVFADGGLWANNPVMVGLIEAMRLLQDRQLHDETIEIYCLGTFPKPDGNQIKKSKIHRGLWGWKFGAGAASLSVSAQGEAFHQIARQILPFLKRKVEIIRLPQGPSSLEMLEYLELDETRNAGLDALVRQAHRDAQEANSRTQNSADSEGVLINKLFESMKPRPPKVNEEKS